MSNDIMFPEFITISSGRHDYFGNYISHYFRKIVNGSEGWILEFHDDDTVTVNCDCHEVIVEGDNVLGLRAIVLE